MSMPPSAAALPAELKSMHLFRKLDSLQLEGVLADCETVSLSRGQILYHEGAPAEHLYLLQSGKVRLARHGRGDLKETVYRVAGDFFGEESLQSHSRREVTATAMEDCSMLRMDRASAGRLAKDLPGFKTGLKMAHATRQLTRKVKLDWLSPGEIIYLLARKHTWFLAQALAWPVGLMLLSFGLIALLGSGMLPIHLAFILLIAGMYVASLAWIIWDIFDFRNDFSVISSQRVVALERVIGVYDSRQEAPLSTLLSVAVKTGQIGRWAGFGDVVVRTYTGTMTLKRVAHPEQVAALLEEHWGRSKVFRRKVEAAAMGKAIRQRLGFEPPDPQASAPTMETPVQVTPGAVQSAFNHFFHVRFEDGQTVTYRKHWFILFRGIWKPAVLCLPVALFLVGSLSGAVSLFPPLAALLMSGGALFGLGGWALYNYIDWRNDIYQVTADQIIDLEKKPLGREERKAAPLDNILSIEYERVGLAGLILNFGTVTLMVGNTPFTFDYVYNPSQVQQDVFRRMTGRLQEKRDAEAAAERERVSEWIALYHESIRNRPDDAAFSEENTAEGDF